MSERRSKSKKSLESEARREELQRGLKNGGRSRLESMEDDEDDAIFDVVDEEEYQKVVEGRRNGVDFVVDDEGLGYFDDGEEHLGVPEEEYDRKKRVEVSMNEVEDNKTAKKARNLAAFATTKVQQNSMLNFVKPGVTAHNIDQRKAVTNENLLNIDDLLGNMKSSTTSATSALFKSKLPSKSHNSLVPVSSRPRHGLPHAGIRSVHSAASNRVVSRPVPRQMHDEVDNYASYDNANDNTYTDHGYDHDSPPADAFEPVSSFHTPTEKLSQQQSATDVTVITPPEVSHDTADAPAEAIKKISLSTTTKKLVFEPPRASAQRVADGSTVFKPSLGDNSLSLGLADIDGTGAPGATTDASIGTTIRSGSAVIDPKYWLQRSKVADMEVESQSQSSSDVKAAAGEEFINMFWLDACESNGVIYLFGKIPIDEPNVPTYYVSCCVAVHGAERNLFVLPRATGGYTADGSAVRAGMAELYTEVNQLLVPSIIPRSSGQSFRCKSVRRKYAFEHGDVPREETEYMKIVYSAKHPAPSLQECNKGGKFIERVFGATSSALELFLLKRGLMGPCWLTIRNPRTVTDSLSWCKIEIGVENPKFISKMSRNGDILPTPPLVSMCVSMKTVLNPATHLHEIVAISGLIHTKVEGDKDTDLDPKHMKRFTYVRPLGLTCGNNYPSAFPHDLANEIKKLTSASKDKSPVVQQLPNERALLNIFFARVQQEDPDIFASHNLFGFEFDVLLSRAITNKVNEWSRLGRLKRYKAPKNINDRDITSGRILCDTYKAAKEFLRETTYSLTALSQTQLGVDRVEVDPVDVPKYFSNSQDIIKIANHTACDAILVQRLVLKLQIVPLTKQLTNLSGNLWSRTVRGARAERIEYLLLHEFHQLKYVLPERKAFGDNAGPATGASAGGKKTGGNKGGANRDRFQMEDADGDDDGPQQRVGGTSRTRAKASYAGGLVLEPKKGLYDTYILLLDFNSLYPSLIQEYNLCFTTIKWTKYMGDASASTAVVAAATKKSEDDDLDEEVAADLEGDEDGSKALPPLPDADVQGGVLPRVIRTLVERRREVKNLLKKENDPVKRQSFDIRQKALKLTANSMYGCLGFSFSRFYARPIAALVTSMGREALLRTVEIASNQFRMDVIYGDTDSVMINTNSTDLAHVKELGNLVKKEVNRQYKSLELDLDGIFKSMLLLKKKKYAAVVIKEERDGTITYEKELKGLDLVRRDWCPLSKDAGKYVVDQLLSGDPREDIVNAIHEYLTDLSRKVRSNEIEIDQFVVTKGLNKNPRDYPDTKGQPHLQVALAMLKVNKPVNIGDHIPYVICKQTVAETKEGEKPLEATMRAHHPDDVIRNPDTLIVDFEWYLTNQILPPISRLCEPIEGTSTAALSQCLGLDTSKYSRPVGGDDELTDDWGYTPQCKMDDAERFKDCIKLRCKCLRCNQESDFTGAYLGAAALTGLDCGNCGTRYYGRKHASDIFAYLSNRLTLLTRECLRKYYDCWFVCDDPTCHRRTMQQPMASMSCAGDCHGRLVQEYSEAQLHTQLKYFESLFDLKRAHKNKDQEANGADRVVKIATILSELPKDYAEVFRLLHIHLTNNIKDSAYNWVRPSIWSTIFGKLYGDVAAAASASAKDKAKDASISLSAVPGLFSIKST